MSVVAPRRTPTLEATPHQLRARSPWSSVDRLALAGARPVDGASAALFRIAFGLLGLLGVARFFIHGWIDEFYVQPAYHFHYYGFGWVEPWPAWGLYLHFAFMGAAALAVALGYRYRLAVAAYFLLFTYVELIDQTTYLNHYYWVSLAALLMLFMPLGRVASLDARLGRVEARSTVPLWVLWTLRAQLAAVYLFAGLAKLNPDWLLEAQPLSIWLANHDHLPLIGPLLAVPVTAYLFSWAGAAFDCTIVAWLLWPRSRPFAYLAVIAFHAVTWLLFPIGVFPWLMIAATLLFFPPDWPRRPAHYLVRRLRPSGKPIEAAPPATPAPSSLRRAAVLPLLARPIEAPPAPIELDPPATERPAPVSRRARAAVLALLAFAALQLLLPLRHYAYPSNVRWSEDGYRFSWRVMLSEKAGFAEFEVLDPTTGDHWRVSPADYFTPLQVRVMSTQPDMILQAAHIIRDDFAARGHTTVEVRADVLVAFNGRAPQPLIDPTVDLAATPYRPGPKSWVLPVAHDEGG
jgi:hypothetical protein